MLGPRGHRQLRIQRRSVHGVEPIVVRVNSHRRDTSSARGRARSRSKRHRRAHRAVVDRRSYRDAIRRSAAAAAAARNRDLDRCASGAAAVIPFLDKGVVGTRTQRKTGVQTAPAHLIFQDIVGVNAHRGDALRTRRRAGCRNIMYGRTDRRTVGWTADRYRCHRRSGQRRHRKNQTEKEFHAITPLMS